MAAFPELTVNVFTSLSLLKGFDILESGCGVTVDFWEDGLQSVYAGSEW